MEPSNVLKEYLELFTADCGQLKLLVAPNAVVDWFGRTIRGTAKIHDYFRFEIAAQYNHENFDKAEECQPIEQRPSHWKTKAVPTGDVDFVLPLNRVTGIAALKSYADSDLDDDDLELHPLPAGNQTPERKSNVNSTLTVTTAQLGELTPPSSTIKLENRNTNDSQSDSDGDDGGTAPKRLKRTLPKQFSYLRRLPTTSAKTIHTSKRQLTLNTQFDLQMLGDDTSSDEELDADYQQKLSTEYTELKYVEATGMLRAKAQIINLSDTPQTPHSLRGWDRPVRLRISYRRKLNDQQLQIALIIYEHINNTSDDGATVGIRRRNLMTQFNEAAVNETSSSPPANAMLGDDGVIVSELGTTIVDPLLIDLDGVDSGEIAVLSVPPLRTPTKVIQTPPATPKRKPRLPYALSGMTRINPSPTTSNSTPPPKRSAARTLRL